MSDALSSLIDQVNKVVGTEGPPKGKNYIACPECGFTVELAKGVPPATCPSCMVEIKWETGNTPAEAKSKAVKAKHAPKVEPVKKAEPKEKQKEETVETPEKVEPVVEPAPRRRTVRKKAEEKAPETQEPTSQVGADKKAEREKAIKALIKKYKLNSIAPVEVGTAEVGTIGYTIWNDKIPTFSFMEPTDTPQSFKQEFLYMKQTRPNLEMDVVRVGSIEPEELFSCLFSGNLIAGLNTGKGLIRVFLGAKVKIGAILTSVGNLRFVVLGVV